MLVPAAGNRVARRSAESRPWSPAEYADLLARGYRRFGWQVFRPACPNCTKCRSIRIPVQQFSPSGSERRVLRRNAHIRAELHPLFVSREHSRCTTPGTASCTSIAIGRCSRSRSTAYRAEFLSGASDSGRQWLYFNEDRLVGVALMDEVPGAVSLVYFFYDPAMACGFARHVFDPQSAAVREVRRSSTTRISAIGSTSASRCATRALPSARDSGEVSR